MDFNGVIKLKSLLQEAHKIIDEEIELKNNETLNKVNLLELVKAPSVDEDTLIRDVLPLHALALGIKSHEFMMIQLLWSLRSKTLYVSSENTDIKVDNSTKIDKESLAEYLGLSKKSISNTIKSLRVKGYLTAERRGTNQYSFDLLIDRLRELKK